MENRACDRRHDTSRKQTSPGMTHSPWIHVSILVFSTPTEKCFLSDNIYDYVNVSQGKITVPGIDDGEESQLADVSLQKWLLPAAPCRVNHTQSFTPKNFYELAIFEKFGDCRRKEIHKIFSFFHPFVTYLVELSLLNLKSLFRELRTPFRPPRMKIIFSNSDHNQKRERIPVVSL